MRAFQGSQILFLAVFILNSVCGQEAVTPMESQEPAAKIELEQSASLTATEDGASVPAESTEKILTANGYENGLKYFRYQKDDPAIQPLYFKKTELMFGLSMYEEGKLRAITEEEWEAFLDDSVRPRFEGFTVFEGRGDYKGITEKTKVLMILHNAREDEEKLHAIAAEFIERFNQDGVMRIDQ